MKFRQINPGDTLEKDEIAFEEAFDPKQVDEERRNLAKLCNVPASSIILNTNGRFEIHDVDESDAKMMINKLQKYSKIAAVTSHAGRYDFGHFNFKSGAPMPNQKYNVQGSLKLEDPLTEGKGLIQKMKDARQKQKEEDEYWRQYDLEMAEFDREDKEISDAFDALDFSEQEKLLINYAKDYTDGEFWTDLQVDFGTKSKAVMMAQGFLMYGDLYVTKSMTCKDDLEYKRWTSEGYRQFGGEKLFGWDVRNITQGDKDEI